MRAWAVGQVASLRAAAELLRVRASRTAEANGITPWPEFAGQSCYACHHALGDKPLSRGKGPLGVAGWEVWMTAAAEVASRFTPDLYPDVPLPAWEHLPKLKVEMNRANPDPQAVAKLAAEVVTELDGWLADVQAAEEAGVSALPADITRQITHALVTHAVGRDWDALAVHYLGCAAMYHAAGGAKAVLSVPCCHHHLNAQLKPSGSAEVLRPLLRHGLLLQRSADLFTDTLRAQLLRIAGYKTDVVEFVGSEHTPRNLMLRAVKCGEGGGERYVREYAELKRFLGVEPYLETVLKGHIRLDTTDEPLTPPIPAGGVS